MADSAQEMMRQMKSARESKGKDEKKKAASNTDDFYTHLLISKQKRHGLTVALSVFYFILFSLLYNNSIQHGHWLYILPPIILVAILICILPPSEDWVYKPWQAKAQQYERFVSGN